MMRLIGLKFLILFATIGQFQSVVCGAELSSEELQSLTLEAQRVLRDRCQNCHNGSKKEGGRLTVLDYSVLTETVPGETYETYIKPGSLKDSGIWEQVAVLKEMPKNGEPLTDVELKTLRQWIENGAPSWEQSRPLEFLTEQTILKSIRDYLTNANASSVPHLRFFSIANLYNDPDHSERDLNIYRAALSKAVNAMSRGGRVFVPKSIDSTNTVFVINLSDLGWDDSWKSVLKAYPYGMKPVDTPQNPDSRRLYDAIRNIYQSNDAEFDDVAYIRADWFVARATRPQIYHELLGIPDDLQSFYSARGIDDYGKSFRNATLKRAGMFRSLVSSQNRLVEVHKEGKVWLSYDFKSNSKSSNLSLRPLGPKGVSGNESLEQFAFEHDGGEIIFELDNGLHGYMLIRASDNRRIDEGPVQIVFDATQVSGSPLIVTGLSCLACHKTGLKPLTDDIREGHSLTFNPDAAEQVKALYPPKPEMDAILDKANRRYQDALREAIGEFFDPNQDLMKVPEPIGFVAQDYEHNIDLKRAALELGLSDPDELKVQIRSRSISSFGLAPLGKEKGAIKRAFWETSEGLGASVFQHVAGLIGSGTPVGG